MFLHIGGHGSVQDLASAVGKVFRAAREMPPASPRAEIDPARTFLTTAGIETALGAKGELKDGVLRFTFGKTARMHGESVGAAMLDARIVTHLAAFTLCSDKTQPSTASSNATAWPTR